MPADRPKMVNGQWPLAASDWVLEGSVLKNHNLSAERLPGHDVDYFAAGSLLLWDIETGGYVVCSRWFGRRPLP